MVTFFKQMFVGWFILTLITFAAYPQEPTNLSAAHQNGPAHPPAHASPHEMMYAPLPPKVDEPAASEPSTPFAISAGSAQAGHQGKNGSEYFSGSGTEADPWLFATAEDLSNLQHFVGEAHQDKHFKQTAGIDLGVSPWVEGEGWVPIGNSIDPFHGHYDGSGHEVSNLVIVRDTVEYQGLFGRNNGTIMNLGVVNATVTDNGSRAGILVGLNDAGMIDNCTTSGTIQCDHEDGRIGGLAGWNNGTIRNSSSSASVNSTGMMIGCLLGTNSGGGLLKNSFASGDVVGYEDVGGLAGRMQLEAHTVSCYATGNVNGAYDVGGLIGRAISVSTIDSCYATGKVSGIGWIGGIAAAVVGSFAKNSFFSGIIEGESRVGGLTGVLSVESTISECYTEGTLMASGNWVGGLVGMVLTNSVIKGCFSSADVHAEGYSIGGLDGSMESNSSVEYAYATGNVSGMDWTGGLVGWFDESTMEECYFTGLVSGKNSTGGLVGWVGESVIINSFLSG